MTLPEIENFVGRIKYTGPLKDMQIHTIQHDLPEDVVCKIQVKYRYEGPVGEPRASGCCIAIPLQFAETLTPSLLVYWVHLLVESVLRSVAQSSVTLDGFPCTPSPTMEIK